MNLWKQITIPSLRLLNYFLVSLWLICLSGCASVKGYSAPDLPDEKLATIAIKAPVTALVPVFWIFPLNMLNWFADDWRETSWTDATITAKDIELSRFTSVKVLPGVTEVNLKQTFIIGQRSDGNTQCSTSSCICTEIQENGATKKSCSTSCETPMVVMSHDRLCHIFLSTEAGQRYEAFIRNGYLKIYDISKKRTLSANCQLSREIHTPFTEKSSSSCKP